MNLLRSEWTKFRSLRSTWLTMAVTALLGVGVAALASSAKAHAYDPVDWDPTATSLTSIIIAQLASGVLGVLVVTSEYATGSIQPSVVAVPVRGRLLAAKAVVLGGSTLLLSLVIGFASFFAGQAMIAAAGVPHATLGQPGVLRAVIGSGLYLTAIGLLGVALGAVLRSTAGAIGVLVSATLLIRLVAQMLPETWSDWMGRYWPTAAGENIMNVLQASGALPPWIGFAVLCGFVAVIGAAGYTVLRTRDV
ncbi:ABC transporter permease [Amycolatopsis sp. YIM 10]|uniref:ABC transporter permease n=1 Tax=Amycolatopsis sp. YIM 10 TaxID=2653857 RepID=UPI0012906992|nr:ABC transporter permease [Amycolatopsis sp. YIM 10]QFU86876.1 ABC-2 family transporter protein [Amycolatopsis sp. YIM 10]